MSAAVPDDEQGFIDTVDGFEFIQQDLQQVLQRLDDWLVGLIRELQTQPFSSQGLNESSALAAGIHAIHSRLQADLQAWPQQWQALAPAQALADSFGDQAIVLVFGKFNAGKSSLCNFLADRFAAHGKRVRYFFLEAGGIVETDQRLQEGATETTARIQGVRLGEKLVLLDTPGLHSATEENAQLTRRFTDSADGVLWLSPSASPGQVQELDELQRELRRRKPLLPVITRSDAYEEDEVDGQIVKQLCNKSADNRAQQEDDVATRARDKLIASNLDAGLLLPPVSVSAHVAREQGQTPEALQQAGFERLYAALMSIAQPALAYKRRKPAEVLLHHLDENILGALHSGITPQLQNLQQAAQSELAQLPQRQARIVELASRSLSGGLPALLERHASMRNIAALCRELTEQVLAAFSQVVGELLADYMVETDASLAEIPADAAFAYEEHAVEIDGRREVIGVDYQRLHAALEQATHGSLSRLAAQAAGQCRASIQQVGEAATRLQEGICAREQALAGLKSDILGAITQSAGICHA
ncbi:MAG: 50S ribosome-binding GTPase [Pseudoxanthomonas sp.]